MAGGKSIAVAGSALTPRARADLVPPRKADADFVVGRAGAALQGPRGFTALLLIIIVAFFGIFLPWASLARPDGAVPTRVMPTSTTAAPGFTISAVIRPGTPAAATTMSARRTWLARSFVPVWHSVTVAFSLRRVSSRPSGRPTVTPRPITVTSAPARGTSYRRSSSTMPRGVHGSGAPLINTRRPRLTGCRPSASFAGSIDSRTRCSSSPAGRGSCTR